MKQSRAILKTWFEKGDRPTQAQFGDLIDSIFNLTDDVSLLGTLSPYDPTKVYAVDSVVIQDQQIWACTTANTTGAFNPVYWNPLPGKSLRYLSSAPIWASSTSYSIGDFVTRLGNVYRCNTAHTADGSNTPPNNSYWDFVEIFDDKVQNWGSGVWLQGDVVFYNRSFYKLLDTVLYSTDLPTELVAGSWRFVSQPNGWLDSTQYVVDEFVWVGTVFYRCLVNHTSTASFAADVISGYWQSYNVNLPLSLDFSSSIVSNVGPWVFNLVPDPNALIGVFVNGCLQKLGYDYTQTGANNEIITWISPDFDLEIGDELIIVYQ